MAQPDEFPEDIGKAQGVVRESRNSSTFVSFLDHSNSPSTAVDVAKEVKWSNGINNDGYQGDKPTISDEDNGFTKNRDSLKMAKSATRSFFFLAAFVCAIFPSVMKIYETSHWYREGDPSVYDDAKVWFSNPNLPFQECFDNSKVLMRVYYFILPYIASSFCVAVGLCMPSSPQVSSTHLKKQRRVFGSFLRRTLAFPKPLVRLGMSPRVSVAEIMGVLLFLALNITTAAVRVRRSLPRGSRKIQFLVDNDEVASKEAIDPISWQASEVWAKTLGVISILNLGWYLLMPVGRKSVLLEALNISWERAIKYHRWVGYWSVAIMVAHGLMYISIWIHSDSHYAYDPEGLMVQRNMVPWFCGSNECDADQARMLRINMYGFVTLFLILIMTVFTLPWIRRQHFEWFYYVHHLFFLVLLFITLHYKGSIIYLLPGIAIYGVDKLMALSAYKEAGPVATRMIGDDVLEISFKIGPWVKYKAGDYVFLNVPAVSFLQWHPFSVTSAPSAHGSIVFFHLKSCGPGSWTQLVIDEALKQGGALTVRLDGFYGVNNGICKKLQTPTMVLSLLVEELVLHRELCETSKIPVTLMWVVRSLDEFAIFSDELASAQRTHKNFNAKAWVTLSTSRSARNLNNFSRTELLQFNNFATALKSFKDSQVESHSPEKQAPTFVLDQPSLSGASNAIVMTLSIAFALVSYALTANFYNKDGYADTAQDFISLVELCMVCLFVLLWVLVVMAARYFLARRSMQKELFLSSANTTQRTSIAIGESSRTGTTLDLETVSSDDEVLQTIVGGSIGCRLKIEQEFDEFADIVAEKAGRSVDIAVLACGPPNMVKSINNYINVPSTSCSFGIEKDQKSFFSFIEEDWEW